MTDSHPFCLMSSHSWDMAIWKFDHENPWYGPCVWSKVKVTLLAQQPIDLLLLHLTSVGPAIPEKKAIWKFDLEKSKVKVMTKVKTIDYIWGQVFNRYVHFFYFVATGSFCHKIYLIPYLTLIIQGQGHGQGQTWWSHLRHWGSIYWFAHIFEVVNHFWLRYSKFHIWPWKFQGQGHGQGQTQWSHLRPRVQSIGLLLVSRQLDHFWLRYRKFYIWPPKFKVKVSTKIAQNLIG